VRLLVTAPDWVAALLLLLLVLAALQDGWRLRISDWISGLVAILAFVALVLDGPVSGLWQNFLLFAGVLAVGTFMFGRGWMGGGDIKLLVIMIVRRLPWSDAARSKVLLLSRRGLIPYGIAIALGVALMGWWLR